MRTIAAALLALSTLAACARGEPARDSTATDTPAAGSARVLPPERTAGVDFDPRTVRPGERIGALQLVAIEASPVVFDSSIVVGRATFAGELELAGRTFRHPDPEVVAVCFEADLESARRMPRWRGDERRPWFCFRDTADAARRLAQPGVEQAARVVIADFTIVRGLSDEVNQARLVSVSPTGPAR